MENQHSNWEEVIEQTSWIWAKSYANTHPHWYIRENDHPILTSYIINQINTNGKVEKFKSYSGTTSLYKYWYHGKYKYWYIFPVVNRALIKRGKANG